MAHDVVQRLAVRKRLPRLRHTVELRRIRATREHDARLVLANQAHELRACFGRGDDTRVGQSEVHARGHSENLGGLTRFGGAELCRTARAHLALREVDYRRSLPLRRGLEERTTTRELDIVAMRGDGQNVYGRHGENIRARRS